MKFINKILKKHLITAEDYKLLQKYKKILQNKTRKILLDVSEEPERVVYLEKNVIETAILQAVKYIKKTFSPPSLILLISDPQLMKNRLRSMGESLLFDKETEIESFSEEMFFLNQTYENRIKNKKLAGKKLTLFSKQIHLLLKLAGKKDGALFFNCEGDLCGTLQNIEGVTRKSVENIVAGINHTGSGTTAAAYIANEVPDSLAIKVSGEGEERGRILAFHGRRMIFQFNPKKYSQPLIDLYGLYKKKTFFR